MRVIASAASLAAMFVAGLCTTTVNAAEPAFAAVIEQEVPAIMKAAKIQGAAFGLIANGKLVYSKGFGFADHAGTVPVTPDTVFVAASLSKPIAARLTMTLAAQGRFQLDQPVADLLTPWPLAPSQFDHRRITIRHLLSHTAGTSLGGYEGWLDYRDLPSLAESLAGKTNGRGAVELIADAGATFQYSGGGYTLLQLAIERTMQRKYSQLAQQLVFQPLAMQHTSVAMSPQVLAGTAEGHGEDGEPVPMRYYIEQAPSGLSTSVNDFAKWMAAGMYGNASVNNSAAASANRTPLRDDAPTQQQLAAMYEPATLIRARAPDEAVYGLGHFIDRLADGSLAVGHDGRNQAGFRAKFLMRPQERDGIVFFSNSRTGLALDRVVCLWAEAAAKTSRANRC